MGRFELANGGTIFLDEIGGEVATGEVQSKLLRVLQDGEFEKLGGESRTRKVDVRIIAATNRNLREAMENGHFREDLFYRLNTVRLKLLALRKRPEDVPVLIAHFCKNFAKPEPGFTAGSAIGAAQHYGWRATMRELENAIQRARCSPGNHKFRCRICRTKFTGFAATKKPLSLEELEKRQIDLRFIDYRKCQRGVANFGHRSGDAALWRKRKKCGLAD
ncbi:MAG: sigma 54-interacting transcriptional regulator [Calditrichia bacterium]